MSILRLTPCPLCETGACPGSIRGDLRVQKLFRSRRVLDPDVTEVSRGIENVFIDNCQVLEGAKLNHLVFIKTNERMGGYVRNIYASNIQSGKIDLGVLGIETDVLYQWRTLVPTYERRLTPIKNIYLTNIQTGEVKFVSRILGQKELPVENITLKNVTTGKIEDKKHIHENIKGFVEHN